VLAGFMGTGKSTIGPPVARRLGRPFIDTDVVIETEMELPISSIFARYGEAIFRERERAICAKLSAVGGQVIAVGGGALMDPANRVALASTGVIILLTCERNVLASRLRELVAREERPLLGRNFEATIDRLLDERKSVYCSIAMQVDTTHLSPEQAAERVVELYSLACENRQVVAP
jgi:shikimate kinase